ncbi:sulfurtransferase-like selenium metabolism protein YedF [Desulfosarcina sp. OttesenSCG-928-A07]|nr:sulfurtransferase-like selenium metabolism protein YedF [Desulfosarcina sp. OttesenSCG-928-G17]MDL2329434.1 sulfurtransferase-like selenium metabolism protein YedF [Desulfosarcina sp. OttesenSCG-928-A07]
METLDARGLDCPAPVLKTRALVEARHPRQIAVTVDNEPARQNVSRFLSSQGYQTDIQQDGPVFTIVGTLREGVQAAVPQSASPPVSVAASGSRKIMVMVAADRIGRGDDTLGAKLMGNFISTLKEMGTELWRLVFVNSGVRLTTTDAPTLAALKDLEASGVMILVCGTCLDFFNLLDRKEVGETTNMLDIVTAMQLSDMVINL